MSEVAHTNKKINSSNLTEEMNKSIEGLTTKSAQIRKLHADGFARADIARHLNIIYQHVRNVLVTKTKKHAPL